MDALKEFLKWLALFAVVLVVQTTIIPKIAIFGISPDLLLILLFVFSVQYGATNGIWTGFSLGVLIDVFSAGILGANALAKTVIGATAGFFDRRNMAIDPILQLIILLIMVILHDVMIYIVNLVKGDANLLSELPMFVLVSAFPRAIYTTIVAVIIFMASEILFPAKMRR